jgi:hypothetical protein
VAWFKLSLGIETGVLGFESWLEHVENVVGDTTRGGVLILYDMLGDFTLTDIIIFNDFIRTSTNLTDLNFFIRTSREETRMSRVRSRF